MSFAMRIVFSRPVSFVGAAIILVWLFTAHSLSQTALAGEEPNAHLSEKAISLGRATWDTGWFQAEIFKALLEELGYKVEGPKTYDTPEFYRALARGDVDFWANGWFPLHNAFINDEEVRGKVELVGYEARGGALQGYLIDKQSADRFGITNLGDLKDPEQARIFDRDGNGKADLIGCNPGWGCEIVIKHHLDEYGLHDTVEHVQGDYSLLIYDAVSRYRRGESILFYTWTPNWTVGALVPGEDVTWLEVPFASLPEDQRGLESRISVPGVAGCGADPCAMGWPPNDIRVVANKTFLQENPAIRRLVEQVVIPLEDIHAQNVRMIKGEGSAEDFRRHAIGWINQNRKEVSRWLSAARFLLRQQQTDKKEAAVRAEDSGRPKATTLRVATKRFEPLVTYRGNRYAGFSVELWEKIAKEIGIDYELYGVNSLAKLLDDVERGAAGVATAGIGITCEREKLLDFSHPFFESGLQIMVRENSGSVVGQIFSKVIATILSPQLLYVIGFLLLLLLISAHLIWLVERRRNPQFPREYFKGIWESFWWAAVTITTVGYGDKTPRGSAGRLIALFWMFSGFFILAYFTASVTSTITVQQLQGTIRGPNDLFGKSVVTVKRSTAAEYLSRIGLKARVVENIDEAIRILMAEQADAVVYDAPVLKHHASHEGKGEVKVVGQVFWKQNYGIALQEGSPHREAVNRALLRLMETGEYQAIYEKWFGTEAKTS